MIHPWIASDPQRFFRVYIGVSGCFMLAALIGTVTLWISMWTAILLLLLVIPCLVLLVAGDLIETKLLDLITRRFARVEDRFFKVTEGSRRGPNGIAVYRFSAEISEWCAANLSGIYGILPQTQFEDRRIIWFTDPRDAIHFKMRWL